MVGNILIGFPLRRCSWSFLPIVAGRPTRSMLRWLDAVCVRRQAEAFRAVADPRVNVRAVPDRSGNPAELLSCALAPRAGFRKRVPGTAVAALSSQ